MKAEQQIKQIETELQELLKRIMQTPLNPITEKMQKLQSHLEEVEDLVKEIRDVDLGGLSLSAQDAEKQIRSLKSIAENTPRDVQKTVQPLLQQEIKQLEHAQHANIEQLQIQLKTSSEEKERHLLETLSTQMKQQSEQSQQSLARLLAHTERAEHQSAAALEQTSQDLTAKIMSITTMVTELQATLAAQARQSSSALEQATQNLTAQISAQATSISKLQTMLDEQARQSASSLERTTQDLTKRISTLAEIAAEQRTTLAAQSGQVGQLQLQQAESTSKLAEQVAHALRPVRQWLIAAVSVASAGLIGTVVLAARQFY